MRAIFQLHVVAIVGSAVAGTVIGARFIDPAVLGGVLGLGAGLGGGAFVTALATGTNLAGGRGPTDPRAIWDDDPFAEEELPSSGDHRN